MIYNLLQVSLYCSIFKCEMKKCGIFKTIHPLGLLIYRCIRPFEETGDVNDRHQSSRSCTIRTPQVIKAVKLKIKRNPLRKQQIMARDMNIKEKSVSRIIKEDLELKCRTGHFVTVTLKKKRLENANVFWWGTCTEKFGLPIKKFYE